MSDFKQYRRKQIAELRPWVPGEDLTDVSVSKEDVLAGSPKPGDMIARNPKNHDDKWLVAAQYFADNFEPKPIGSGDLREAQELRDMLQQCRGWLAYAYNHVSSVTSDKVMAALPLIDAKIAALSAQPQPAVGEAVAWRIRVVDGSYCKVIPEGELDIWKQNWSHHLASGHAILEPLGVIGTAPPLAPDARMRRALERIRDDGPDHGVRWCRNIASEALRADEGKESEGGCMADFSPGDPANLQELMSGASPSDPTPAEQREAIAQWPDGCRNPNSCSIHRDCMYLQCKHYERDISGEVDAALSTRAGG